MKALLKFEFGNYFKKSGFYVLLLLLIMAGALAGSKFGMAISPDIFKNSSYTIAYMLGLMSLLSIFFSTILATQILFTEKDCNFNLILYATPLRKRDYLLSRFLAVFLISFICFMLFTLGFAIGQQLPKDRSLYTHFNLSFYLHPLIVFGLVNTFFCSAILCSVAWLTKNKLMVYVSGLFIYIMYMVALIFSGSPMIARGMPQSAQAMQASAILDPFGLSAYFLQTANWSVIQRNTELASLSGSFLINRAWVILSGVFLLFVTFKNFRFSSFEKRKKKIKSESRHQKLHIANTFKAINPVIDWTGDWATLISFTRLDLKYITKSIPFILTSIGLLFHLSMEFLGSIEGGIRLPEKYASSGLMASTIIENFHSLCLIIILYYAHEIVWRSRNSNFNLIENSTAASNSSLFFSKWLTLSIVVIFFSTLLILEGIVFQFAYNYPHIDWSAYAGVYFFNSLPLILSAGIILIAQKLINNKYIGLAASAAIILFTATSFSKYLFTNPLLRFQNPYNGLYSDMNGFGAYTLNYGWRILFGLCVVTMICILILHLKKFRLKPVLLLPLILLLGAGCFFASKILQGYQPKDKEATLQAKAEYEKRYRRFQYQEQPTITDVTTNVDLFPEKNAYHVIATYLIKNKTDKPISNILVNFGDGLEIGEASIITADEILKIKKQYSIIQLKKPLLPDDTARLNCQFSYHWVATNGHEPFNAIIENGSFMRISRYFPRLGYQSENEIEESFDRERFGLGKSTSIVALESPKDSIDDFINLNMTISTNSRQTAIGNGELVKKWQDQNRNYFQYQTSLPVPFRFAVSSAEYAVKTAEHNGKIIEVYYHPSHKENVPLLLDNAKLSLDYCEKNFGAYPFHTLRFVEVSAFTKGFAATAYPTAMYFTEDMGFHANISKDKEEGDLTSHELAHTWWGNIKIVPDNREGAVMLTETLAMYTELMMADKMQGKERVLEMVKMHLGIYLSERGFMDEQPLFKVQFNTVHLRYSKGVVVMYQLRELIGEEKVNLALKHFLQHHAYPNPKPVSTDFINEVYAVTDTSLHSKIDDLFKRITLYDFNIKNTTVKKTGNRYELTLNAIANKYYEDGKGHRTKVPFTDSVEVAVYLKSGKERIWKLSIINNEIYGKLVLDEEPTEIEIDPDIRFMKKESEKQMIIPNKL